MKPEEKAKQIVNKIINDLYKNNSTKIYSEDAVICALILVNEILDLGYVSNEPSSFRIYNYFSKVKEHLENY